MATTVQQPLLLQLYHHVVLPRDIPAAEDSNLVHIETELLDRLLDAVKALVQFTPLEHHSRIYATRIALTTCKAINIEGRVDMGVLIQQLQQLESEQALILYVHERNAALLIYRHHRSRDEKDLIFEAFETSATCEQVLASSGALRRDFPGIAVAVPSEVHSEDSFIENTARFLEQASIESIKQFSATTSKAGEQIPEVRDTANPALITTLFMTILQCNGSRVSSPILRKRIRDTVSFDKAYKPWRRSPFYLVLRVAIQRQLSRLLGTQVARAYYKIVICILLSRLLAESLGSIPAAASHSLKRKLGRRLAKLEHERETVSPADRQLYDNILQLTRRLFEKSLSAATKFLQNEWDAFALRTQRPIQRLSHKADAADMALKLPSSGPILDRILRYRNAEPQSLDCDPVQLLSTYEKITAIAQPFASVATCYLELAAFDEQEVIPCFKWSSEKTSSRCIALSRTIHEYIASAGVLLDDYPVLKSQFLIRLLEVWVLMDQVAISCYPLLRQYHPGMDPSLLDALELTSSEEIRRAGWIQKYLMSRCGGCRGLRTIFDRPSKESFAVLYYDNSSNSEKLLSLRENIESHAEAERKRKETEWEELSKQHQGLTLRVAESSCPYVMRTTPEGNVVREHQKGCPKHRYKWQAKQITIKVFEHPLPKREHAAKAAVFELACPAAFGAYRDATWKILATFVFPKAQPDANVPIPAISRYTGLSRYSSRTDMNVSLGSSTKSHLDSHYKESGFPVTLDQICRPCGLKLDYFDSAAQTWISSDMAPSFASHFPLKLPRGSPYQSLELSRENWPSSNEIIASQTDCPSELNVHEFMAWQGLLIGSRSRWLSLLRELGATSINVSSESTWGVISKLIHEIGSSTPGSRSHDHYAVFEDSNFCKKLLDQVSRRLIAIESNWRESIQMDILISLSLKIVSFTESPELRAYAYKLLNVARESTWDWCTMLQSGSHDASKEDATFAIWAAVLCKRTFHRHLIMDHLNEPETLRRFFAASVYLHDGLSVDFSRLSFPLRNAVLTDLLFTYRNRDSIRTAIMTYKHTLLSAVCHIWPAADSLTLSATFETLPHTRWILIILASNKLQRKHYVHYNYVHGDLLINGKQSGALPAEYLHPVIEKLFGTQNLRVLPSHLPGMSLYVTRTMPYGHRVHLGFRNNQLVVQAIQGGQILQYVLPEVFRNGNDYDVPFALVDDCYHWLNLDTGIIEVRQEEPWKSKDGNWRLDLLNRRAVRRKSVLVDPHSNLARRIANNFRHFEHSYHLTIFQPEGRLAVELKRLELTFFVNYSGLLQCRQLAAEIPFAQNIGTWVGLKSQLVLQSTKNPCQRIVLIPEGKFTYVRQGPHVEITIANCGTYLKFDINEVLGRIDCAAEPRLLYTRALWHAYTAYFLPDRLRAGQALKRRSTKLSPGRAYYPPNMKYMEVVSWNPGLTTVIQDDRYRGIVASICQRSSQLSVFTGSPHYQGLSAGLLPDAYLAKRAMSRTYLTIPEPDEDYRARDTFSETLEQANAASIMKLLVKWPSAVTNTTSLASLLEKYPIIAGQVGVFERVQIFDLLTVNLGKDWGAILETARKSEYEGRFDLMFLFTPMAFSTSAPMELLRVLISFALLPELKAIEVPNWLSYSQFRHAELPSRKHIADLIQLTRRPFAKEKNLRYTYQQLKQANIEHEEVTQQISARVANALLRDHWPTDNLPTPELMIEDVTSKFNIFNHNKFDYDELSEVLLPEWNRLAQNYHFSVHIDEIQDVLDRVSRMTPEEAGLGLVNSTGEIILGMSEPDIVSHASRAHGTFQPALRDFLQKSIISPLSCWFQEHECSASTQQVVTSQKKAHGKEHLPSSCSIRLTYADELKQSIAALAKHVAIPTSSLPPISSVSLSAQIRTSTTDCEIQSQAICKALEAGDRQAKWLHYAGLWPSITRCSLFAELNSIIGTSFGPGIKEALVVFGVTISKHQRLLRIEDATAKAKDQQLRDETSNFGHENWDPLEYVDWLLLEIDGNIMLRPEQIDVAHAMISPTTGKNSIVQLLMGKGKTSCILPMVAAVLANAGQLLRIIVPRPLLLQSAQVLQSKLGGLLNRKILHIPFSRKTVTSETLLKTFENLHRLTMKKHGVLLALPEHILSFKLSGKQRLSDKKLDEAAIMIKMQRWLDEHARDVLDECDVSLAVRTQLIYPSGSQMTVDGHPLRWQTIEALLHLLRSHLPDLVRKHSQSIEIVPRIVGDFPFIYLLRSDIEEELVARLVNDVSNGRLSTLPCAEISSSARRDIKMYISAAEVPREVDERIIALFKEKQHLMQVMYHLRGMFVHTILLSSQKKRWNVQYGLHPTRDPVAVPYHAKGVPSPTSEWGHPDVAILLTCLSFYYQGLDLAQFKQAFEQLSKADEPSIEYDKWITPHLPDSLRTHNAINVEDGSQLRLLHDHVRFNVRLLDFYMNTFVFPRHAKQFTTKLQASGWDLVQYDPAQNMQCQTTGFSGTNDCRHQLPMTIKQDDLQQLTHTNAEVLFYLLNERNRRYVLATNNHGKRLNEIELLERLSHQGIRILIDAGAQILEHMNRDFVPQWLKIDYQAVAAVFFDDDHRAWIQYRKGKVIPLLASPYAENLDDCLVYLDESHCRGTDLKLPPSAKAALTLGLHLTKDALAQAAMRLRLLGQSQSVTFFSPPEVHQSILDLVNKGDNYHPDSSDVVRWLLEQSCKAIEQLEPLYCNQGITYITHTQAQMSYPLVLNPGSGQRDRYLDVLRSKELRTLEQMYAPKAVDNTPEFDPRMFAPSLATFGVDIHARKNKTQARDTTYAYGFEEVEQEREMEDEVECAVKPSPLHPHIGSLATTGILIPRSSAYVTVFDALRMTALGQRFITDTTLTAGLYVSTQFLRTIDVEELNDNFLRPSHWILWSSYGQCAVIVSPEEADALLSILQHDRTEGTYAHLIVYAAPVTRRMLHFNDLTYYATPPLPSNFEAPLWLKVELGLFAGRLYFGFDEYSELMSYLSGSKRSEKRFAEKPLTFLHEWLALLRKGQDFEYTPMGFVAAGRPLTAEHAFFQADRHVTSTGDVSNVSALGNNEQTTDDDDEGDHDEEMFDNE
ncbi:Nn.00g024500.m01.CDS01 [Neocucurbitaria sp. VM-36]